MKYVQVPEPIRLIDPNTKQDGGTLTLEQYATAFWFNSPRWQTPLTNMASLVKLVDQFKKLPGEWMQFEDQEYKLLVPIIKEPDTNQGKVQLPLPLIYVQLIPYETAVFNALDSLPTQDNN